MDTTLKTLLRQLSRPAGPELVLREEDHSVRCVACGNRCLIRDGHAGICQVRFNEGGELRVPGGYVAGLQADPIEKKPFYHAYPGREALSFGMLGCNMHCAYCQNWVNSQALRDEEAATHPRPCTAGQIVASAVQSGAPVIVSTYNEPLITSEWAMEVFRLAHEKGIECGYVSNGNASPEVLEYLRPCMRLFKIDLKSFQDRNYRKLGCPLQNVLDTIQRAKAMDFWVEVVTLVVPDFNDSDEELRQMAEFLAGVSPGIPWHVTAFHPDYRMTDPRSTRAEDLERACRAGHEAGMHHVYAGNLPGGVAGLEHTYCPGCHALLIERRGFLVLANRMDGGQCPECHIPVAGVWEASPPRKSTGPGFPRSV